MNKILSWQVVLKLGIALCLEIFQIIYLGLFQLCFPYCIQWCKSCLGEGVLAFGVLCFWIFKLRHYCLCKFHRHCHSIASLLSSSKSWVFIVSAAALLGRKGSFPLCGYSWFLCGCWCWAEVFFFFYSCGVILTLRGETSWIQDVVFHGCWVQCTFRFVFANKPGIDYLSSVSHTLLLLASLNCRSTQRLQWTPALLNRRCCLYLWLIAGCPKGFAVWKAEAGRTNWDWDAKRWYCRFAEVITAAHFLSLGVAHLKWRGIISKG